MFNASSAYRWRVASPRAHRSPPVRHDCTTAAPPRHSAPQCREYLPISGASRGPSSERSAVMSVASIAFRSVARPLWPGQASGCRRPESHWRRFSLLAGPERKLGFGERSCGAAAWSVWSQCGLMQTCAKVPKRSEILGSLSPRSGTLMDLGP